jgi:hypothetical protein
MKLYRDHRNPYEQHLLSDVEIDENFSLTNLSKSKELYLKDLPKPILDGPKTMPKWNSVALFFNLTDARKPSGYANTTVQDASNWLDEGIDPCKPAISEFLTNYWSSLSLGKLAFGINTPKKSNLPVITTLSSPSDDWSALINEYLDLEAELIWKAAGGLMRGTKRWIPSLVLVQKYPTHASAYFGGYDRTVGGIVYEIGDTTHIQYDLTLINLPGVIPSSARDFWGILCHEFSHNFLEFGDFYGPQGCTGYWDLLGDNTPPSRMSEVCSHIKERVGWITFKHIIKGPSFLETEFSLAPYTKSGDAIKIIPDPDHNPYEFFLLEYRKHTGNEVWKPDGGLSEEGLLIIHMNERIGLASTWLLRDAPYFDPEFADFSDNGGALWTGHDRLNGILYPYVSKKSAKKNSFTRSSNPNSNFYGGRPSGLKITNIKIESGKVHFKIQIKGNPRVGWTVGPDDRCIGGKFTLESSKGGQEIFCRNDDSVSLLIHRQAQWLVGNKQDDWIGGWNLGADNRELAADLDGDGFDEIYIRSPDWAGVLKWDRTKFDTITVQQDWIDGWNLGEDNRELAADVDGDGKDEIFIRSPEWVGIIKLIDRKLSLQSIQNDRIDDWKLGSDNWEHIGRFTQSRYDEILIRSPEWLGVLYWDSDKRLLRLRQIQHDFVDGWNLGADDKEYVGDFDGDGFDEIYIRSPSWAGVLKWQVDRFNLIWIRQLNIEHINGNSAERIDLTSDDQSYVGNFLPDRECILHRNENTVAILSWQDSINQMRIRQYMRSWLDDIWNLGANDKFILGDFHRLEPDIGDPSRDYIFDNLTDVFIHNAWGTGMFGVNVGNFNSPGPYDIDQIGLSWMNPSEIMFDT